MNAFCRAYSESESVSLSLFFVPAFVFVTFLCQIRMFPDWCFPQTLSQLPLPFFFICPLFLSVSLVLILCLYHVRQCRCFLVSPEGHEACFSVAVFVFFSDVPLSFFVAVFGFICCLCLRHYLWCQMRMFSDGASSQGVEKLGSFRAISSQHPDQLPPFIIVSR